MVFLALFRSETEQSGRTESVRLVSSGQEAQLSVSRLVLMDTRAARLGRVAGTLQHFSVVTTVLGVPAQVAVGTLPSSVISRVHL